jgi:hypothetical protein
VEHPRLTHKPTGAVFAPYLTDDAEPVCRVLDAGKAGAGLEEIGREGAGWFRVFGGTFVKLSRDGKY